MGVRKAGTVASSWHLVTATYDGTTALLYVDQARGSGRNVYRASKRQPAFVYRPLLRR